MSARLNSKRVEEIHVTELLRIKGRRKLLRPEEVVRAARPKGSPLHRFFEWNDGRAATFYRIEQARTLIQLAVSDKIVNSTRGRVFVSLTPSRVAGGYLETRDVLNDRELRNIMLLDAVEDVLSLRGRYGVLPELAPVWRAAEVIGVKAGRRRDATEGTRSASASTWSKRRGDRQGQKASATSPAQHVARRKKRAVHQVSSA